MQRGKYKCKQLKAVRKRIAEENGIPLKQKECTYEGPCRGTCPYCEAEMRYLEHKLTDRIRLGKVATVAGLSLGLAACGGQNSPGDTTPMLTTEGVVVTEMPGDVIEIPPPPPPEDGEPFPEVGEIQYEDEGESSAFTLPEEDPSFPGGMDSLYAWLERNIRYPKEAKDNNINGKVFVTFVVEPDGRITNIKLLRDIGGGCGAEAIRLVKAMPRWNPGKEKGNPARVQFNLPINFTLK